MLVWPVVIFCADCFFGSVRVCVYVCKGELINSVNSVNYMCVCCVCVCFVCVRLCVRGVDKLGKYFWGGVDKLGEYFCLCCTRRAAFLSVHMSLNPE